jgi:hypothetical protein
VLAVGAQVVDADHAVFVVEHQRVDHRLREHGDARGLDSGLQRSHQCGAGLLRQRVHAVHAVARVEKAVEQRPCEAVAFLQRVERGPDGVRIGVDQRGRRTPVRLGLDVGREARGAVAGHAVFALRARAGRGNETRRQRGRPAGQRIAFEHHAVDACIAQHQRGREPAGTAADNGHRHVHLGFDRRGTADGAHRLRHAIESMKAWHAVTSATLRMSASEVSWRSSPKAAQPSPSTSVR